MKSVITLLFSLVIVLPLCAQKIQKSMVREQNSGKKPVPGAQVVFSEANPVISDNDGLFTLSFPRKKAGEWTFLEDVQKSGYELVNKKEIEQVKLSADERLGVDVILAPAGKLDAARREYYDISDKALLAGFEREKKNLRDKLQKAQLNQQEYEEKYESLQKQYDQQQQQLDQLADKFARVNFDDVSPVYQEALELYKAGHIDQAIAKLESINPAKRTEEIIKEEKRIGDAQKELDARRAALEIEKRQQIANLKLLADMYSADFDPVKAEAQYDQLLRLDSTDVEILINAAQFYSNNYSYDKALHICHYIITSPKMEEWQIANAYGLIGDLHISTGNIPAAIEAYTKANASHQALYSNDTSSSFQLTNFAISYDRLGNSYLALGQLDTALAYFENETRLFEILYTDYPQNMDIKNGLAISYEKQGETYFALGNFGKALIFFENYRKLEKDLCVIYPQNAEFKNNLAISYEKLGDTYTSMEMLTKALVYFEERFRLSHELYDMYPKSLDFKINLAISSIKLGEANIRLGKVDDALNSFKQASKLFKELFEANPRNVNFKNFLAVSYEKLGLTYGALGNLNQALTFFQERTLLGQELYHDYPFNVEFKNNLAHSYMQFGIFCLHKLKDKTKAIQYFKQAEALWVELVRDAPTYAEFQQYLEMTRQHLAGLD